MAHSFLVFDFGTNEEAAQQARHKVEGWKQGFRLGNKITIKFEREEPDSSDSVAKEDSPDEDTADSSPKQSEATGKRKHDGRGKHDAGTKKASAKASKNEDSDISVRVLIRLDFSDHEKLSQQRWLDRIPSEEPFKSVEGEIVRAGEPDFDKITDLFEALS